MKVSVIVAILALAILVIFFATRSEKRYLVGFWKSDAVFNQQANTSVIMMNIDEGLQKGYLLINDDEDDEVYNDKITMSIRRTLLPHKFNCQIEYASQEEQPPWPGDVTFTLDKEYGKLCIADQEGTLLARLFKVNDVTYLLNFS